MSELLAKVSQRLDELKVPWDHLELSKRHGKKIMVIINGKRVHFGDANSVTYIEKRDDEKRRRYIARHSRIFLKDESRAVDKIWSPSWLSLRVLWMG